MLLLRAPMLSCAPMSCPPGWFLSQLAQPLGSSLASLLLCPGPFAWAGAPCQQELMPHAGAVLAFLWLSTGPAPAPAFAKCLLCNARKILQQLRQLCRRVLSVCVSEGGLYFIASCKTLCILWAGEARAAVNVFRKGISAMSLSSDRQTLRLPGLTAALLSHGSCRTVCQDHNWE